VQRLRLLTVEFSLLGGREKTTLWAHRRFA